MLAGAASACNATRVRVSIGRRVARSAALLIAILAIGYAALCVFAYRRYRAALFPAPEELGDVSVSGGELRVLRADDGMAVHAIELAPPPGGRVVAYFHGNNDTIGQSGGLAMDLRRRGLGSMLVEYRGYGVSRPGTPSERGLYLDAKAALDALAGEGITADRIVLWGSSLGTGVAAEMARLGRGAVLVMVSPYTSIPELGEHYLPFLPAGVIVVDRFDTLGKAAQIVVPTLIVHGSADEVVPYRMGEELSRSIAGARLVTVVGGHHNDLFRLDGTRLMHTIVEFAQRTQ